MVCMSNTYSKSRRGDSNIDIDAPLHLIKRQRLLKEVGVLSGFALGVIALFGVEIAMLSQEQAPPPSDNLEPGKAAPWEPD